MKVVVSLDGANWKRRVELTCGAGHSHFATRVGDRVILNCDVLGPIKSWDKVPPGGAVRVELVQAKEAKCSRCGGRLVSTGAGTVHADTKKRGCW